jgi:hypothetical protein
MQRCLMLHHYTMLHCAVQNQTTQACVLLCNRWDKYHTRPLTKRFGKAETLADCRGQCNGNECTFIVWERSTGRCWEKYSW